MIIKITKSLIYPTIFAVLITSLLCAFSHLKFKREIDYDILITSFLNISGVINIISFWFIFLYYSPDEAFKDFKLLLVITTIGMFFFSITKTSKTIPLCFKDKHKDKK